MKTNLFTLLITLFFLSSTLIITGCDENEEAISPTLKKSILQNESCENYDFTTTIKDLSKDDIAGLLLMREEEKLAMDVYDLFFDDYELRIFDNISNSESRHTEAIKTLLDHFKLTDPYISTAGKFSNTDLQKLYNDLVKKGSKSIEDALFVGATIEEVDILDLEKLIANTKNDDLKLVYGNLLRGSENHLRAFNRVLQNYDITYSPQYLSKTRFQEIISGQWEKGSNFQNNCDGQQKGEKGRNRNNGNNRNNGGNGGNC